MAQSLPWKNTVYELAIDPAVPGRMWAAGSNTHDIPNDNVISGRHRVIMQGVSRPVTTSASPGRKLDLPEAPCLSVVLDPIKPAGAPRALHIAFRERRVQIN